MLINATIPGLPGGLPISTGVLVLYADDEAFTVMTPRPSAGRMELLQRIRRRWDDRGTGARDVPRLRSDLRMGFRLMGGGKAEDGVWVHVLKSLAALFGVRGEVEMQKVC